MSQLVDPVPRAQRWLLRACIALPLLMLAANLLSWWRWGFDLPFFDDWRAYDDRNALSLVPSRLFESINNTISPVGLALDTLAQRWLGGNPLPYQTLSMIGVLGSLLWLQWRLLGWALRDRVQQALAFALCFFMLQSGTYWGEQNLAYHQALPLVALLAATLVVCAAPFRWSARGPGIALLGLLAGLSYISGAIAALVLAVAWLLAARVLSGHGPVALAARLRMGGRWLIASGLLTSALQIALTRVARQGKWDQHLEITGPWQLDFWIYLAGKLGRSTGWGFARLDWELAWLALLALVLALAAALLLLSLLSRRLGARPVRLRIAVVALPWVVVVFAYLLLIGMGRSGLHFSPVHGRLELFRSGYERFHFFWITPLFPWVFAALASVGRTVGVRRGLLGGGLLLALAAAWPRAVFDVPAFYRQASGFRATELRCLEEKLGSGQAVACDWHPVIGLPDLSRAYNYARDIEASFVRYMPLSLRAGFGHTLLHWRAADFVQATWRGARARSNGWVVSGDDPQLELPLPGDADLQHCRDLGLRLRMQADSAGTVQLFYRRSGETAYSESSSLRASYQPDDGGHVYLELTAHSSSGFEPQLRLDPADGAARFSPQELHVTCRLRVPS